MTNTKSNTMVPDMELEAQIAEETGHRIGCFEEWMETALEAGADAVEIYALWYQEVGNGFMSKWGQCRCREDAELCYEA
jgi:hypothetical protein